MCEPAQTATPNISNPTFCGENGISAPSADAPCSLFRSPPQPAMPLPRQTQRKRCVVTTVRRMVCYDEKSSKPRAKACAHAARGTGSKNHGSSALADAMLYCTQLSFFSLVITCGLWPRLQLGSSLQSRQSMRRTLVEGRSDAANARVARHWYGLQPSRRPGH